MAQTDAITVSPTLPQAAPLTFAALKIDSTIFIVVVLPLVPVSAIHFCEGASTCLTCQAKSISLRISTPSNLSLITIG